MTALVATAWVTGTWFRAASLRLASQSGSARLIGRFSTRRLIAGGAALSASTLTLRTALARLTIWRRRSILRRALAVGRLTWLACALSLTFALLTLSLLPLTRLLAGALLRLACLRWVTLFGRAFSAAGLVRFRVLPVFRKLAGFWLTFALTGLLTVFARLAGL